MNMQTISAPRAAAAQPPANVCSCVPLHSIPGLPKRQAARCPLLQQDKKQMLAAFQAAPQFSGIPVKSLLRRRQEGLRVLLLGQSDYYNRQAACYLASLAGPVQREETPDDFWQDAGESAYFDDGEENVLEQALTVVSASILDPELNEEQSFGPGPKVMGGKEGKVLLLDSLDTPAILITAPTGRVLSENVLDQVERALHRTEKPTPHIFIALRPEQEESDLLEELRFTHGFSHCRVGQADMDYLCRFLRQTGQAMLAPLADDADPERIVSTLRRYRGGRFEESDLEQSIRLAVERGAAVPLRTEDLLPRPCRSRGQGREQLQSMIGLQGVKDTVERFLATAILEDRRRQKGDDPTPMCRNLAFSGPPGTGKSVTARLMARIMREEGCGTGRFVEAGREDLIAPYLGQTSPQIASLFRKAKGGVLFIDEAGALLNVNNDTYAVEAVNALVRHMELEPETTVIFATYPEEMKQLLRSNPGLSSRVAQVIDFPAYGDADLWDIFSLLARQERTPLPDGARKVCLDFFRSLRARKGDRFGNGREARRLFQTAVQEMAMRAAGSEEEPELALSDLKAAAELLLRQEEPGEEKKIGF